MNNNLDIHEMFMSRALELARQGRGSVSPNPMVGCVLVKDGEIIGEGYHEKFGCEHAEVNAIKNSRKDPVDSTAYVTLEPCNITAKTPPCTQLLVENGIREVFISDIDPNPDISGRGIEDLRNAGIKVYSGVLSDESRSLNKGFYKWVTTGRPWIIAKVAQSRNKFMGLNSNSCTKITGHEAMRHCHELRSEVDSVLVGKQTALIDNPQLTVREIAGNNPKRIILDTNRTLPITLDMFNDNAAETIVICSSKKFKDNSTSFCKYWKAKEVDGMLDVHDVLDQLANHGIVSVLVEGGPSILKTFIKSNLIDEAVVYTSDTDLDNATLKNPLTFDDNWDMVDDRLMGKDNMKIFLNRSVECLVE